MVDKNEINGTTARELLPELASSGESPQTLVDQRGLKQLT